MIRKRKFLQPIDDTEGDGRANGVIRTRPKSDVDIVVVVEICTHRQWLCNININNEKEGENGGSEGEWKVGANGIFDYLPRPTGFFSSFYICSQVWSYCVSFDWLGCRSPGKSTVMPNTKWKKEEKAGDVISSWRTILSEGGRADGGEGNTIFFFTCSLFAAHQLWSCRLNGEITYRDGSGRMVSTPGEHAMEAIKWNNHK